MSEGISNVVIKGVVVIGDDNLFYSSISITYSLLSGSTYIIVCIMLGSGRIKAVVGELGRPLGVALAGVKLGSVLVVSDS